VGQIRLLAAQVLRKSVPDGPPRFLYKYHGFSGEYDKTNLFNWIVVSAFRLSRPIEFNDPFDFHGIIIAEGSKEEIAARCGRGRAGENGVSIA
jgi:hypothetical protein